MYIYSYLFYLYWCKDCCHRLTTKLQLVVVIIIIIVKLVLPTNTKNLSSNVIKCCANSFVLIVSALKATNGIKTLLSLTEHIYIYILLLYFSSLTQRDVLYKNKTKQNKFVAVCFIWLVYTTICHNTRSKGISSSCRLWRVWIDGTQNIPSRHDTLYTSHYSSGRDPHILCQTNANTTQIK
jgi:hypothetical protein